jgi:hypothetical protein
MFPGERSRLARRNALYKQGMAQPDENRHQPRVAWHYSCLKLSNLFRTNPALPRAPDGNEDRNRAGLITVSHSCKVPKTNAAFKKEEKQT